MLTASRGLTRNIVRRAQATKSAGRVKALVWPKSSLPAPPFFPRKQRAVRANPKGQLVTRGKGYRTLSVSTPSGGSLSSSRIFLYRHYGSRIVVANHGKQKSSRNVWMFHPHAFYAVPPPLSLRQKISGPQRHEKHPEFGPSNRLRKPRCPERRIVVNGDPFRKLRFGLV